MGDVFICSIYALSQFSVQVKALPLAVFALAFWASGGVCLKSLA
jgi:hypothetical protein